MDPNSSEEKAILAQDVKAHPDIENLPLTPEKKKENAGPDAKRRDVKTEGDSEVYTSSAGDEGKATSDDEEELSDISDEDVDTMETLFLDGEFVQSVCRNGEMVEFSYVTQCGDFTVLKKALEEVDAPGSRRYKKRFKLAKDIQQRAEKVVKNDPQFNGKILVEIEWTKEKGHLGMSSFDIPYEVKK